MSSSSVSPSYIYTHVTWPLVGNSFSSPPLMSLSFFVSLLLSLSVTLRLSICQSYSLSSLPISPTTRPRLHHRIPATSVSNLVSWQLAFNEGLWWWCRRRWWRRRVGLTLRGGVAPSEWWISALHEDRMFWKYTWRLNYSCPLCVNTGVGSDRGADCPGLFGKSDGFFCRLELPNPCQTCQYMTRSSN